MGVVLRRARLSSCVGGTSVIVAKRNYLSNRAIVKGTPINITGVTERFRGPILTFSNYIARSTGTYRTTKVSTFFPVIQNIVSLRSTVRASRTGRGVASAIRRMFHVLQAFRGVGW